MAPTGKAAHIIQGMTIHSALKMPYKRIGPIYQPLSISTLTTLRSTLSGLKFILIDEISMVGINLFNYVDRRLQDIMGLKKTFGGCHIICIGDLYQLQPVFDTWIFLMPSEGPGALATNQWHAHFKLFELNTIMRQKDHKPFAEMLNRLREGKHTDQDKAFISSKVIRADYRNRDYPHKEVTHLFSTNAAVHDFNIAARKKTPIHILADDHVNGACSKEIERIHLDKMKDIDPKDAQGLETVLTIALEDRVEVSQNIAIRDGLTNGASGTIMKLPKPPDDTDNLLARGLIWVYFDDKRIGAEARTKGVRLYRTGIDNTWTPIEPVTKHLQISRNTQITANRTQFPIRIAAAKTIHRSQGQTLNAVVTDFKAAKGAHMHYVAISRVTNPDHLYVTNFNSKKINTDTDVHDEMARLRTTSLLRIPRHLDYRRMAQNTTACFMNIRRLNKYADDLASDYNHRNSYITIVAETHITAQTDLRKLAEIHPHQDHNIKNMCATDPPAKQGISCFATMPMANITHSNTATMECSVCTVSFPDTCTFICVYRYHRQPLADFFEDLNHVIEQHCTGKIIIVGDMNLNMLDPSVAKKVIDKILAPQNLTQLVTGPTTKAGTEIDHVYTNIDHATVDVIPTYYPDHDI